MLSLLFGIVNVQVIWVHFTFITPEENYAFVLCEVSNFVG